MTTYQVDPLADSRWERLTQSHAHASVFHSQAWLNALHRAYGYQPFVLTTTPPPNELENGIVFCRIASRLTGNRVVSLPFADHCDPLVSNQAELADLLSPLQEACGETRYIEIRPLNSCFGGPPGFVPSAEFRLHRISLRPTEDAMFEHFHKNIQRNIKRAAEKKLRYEVGDSEELLHDFRCLLKLTRKRHGLPPQPLSWFRSVLDCLRGRLAIRIAYKDDAPVAGVLTLVHNDMMVYKYGGYDTRYRDCGGMAFLLWQSIREACQAGLRVFDFGRSDCDNAGLIRFKDGWGGTGSTMTYWSRGGQRFGGTASRMLARWVRHAVPYLPDRLVETAGGLLYRHVG